MANQSTSKKSLRSFHVRNGLWKLFEVKAQEMECSIDYLINEAMRLYARTHNFASSVRVEGRAPQSLGVTNPMAPQAQQTARDQPAMPRPGVPPIRPSISPAMTPPPRSGGMGTGTGTGQVPMPTTGGYTPNIAQTPGPMQTAMPTTGTGQAPMPITGSGHMPMTPGTGQSMPMPMAPPQQRPTLTLIFQRKKIPINAQQFIIGRGSKSSDLAIKDPNISRKHAAIIYHNGAYYLKDLGSTNGIEYKGKQVDSKRIDEGDVFTICGYDLHFTYSV